MTVLRSYTAAVEVADDALAISARAIALSYLSKGRRQVVENLAATARLPVEARAAYRAALNETAA